VNSTYLRLESVASNETKKQSVDEYRKLSAYINESVSSTGKIELFSNNYRNKNGSGERDYKNLVELNEINGNESDGDSTSNNDVFN